MNRQPAPAIHLRPARREDAPQAAALIRLAMGEFADYFFGGNPLSPDEILRELFAQNGGRFSQTSGAIAEANGGPAGLLISYPARRMFRLAMTTALQLLKAIGLSGILRMARRALALANIREANPDEYYVSSLAVFPRFQGRGIGAQLLAYADERALREGLSKCSLIVDTQNRPALRLYQRMGYHIVFTGRAAYPGHRISESAYYRMVKHLSH
jgi:ribosomal protein S18 acetylase RimI-like enzyme